MSKACCVCNDSKESKDNVLFSCKGHGCDVTVHQGCYGIVAVPSGLWFCRKCESQERAARVRCELCPKKEGALKRTDSGGWAHVVCALYIPEVTFGNNRHMEPIVTSKLPKERFTKSCYICEERGKEMQSTYGACMSCHKSSCRLAFHVTCAQKERLLCEEQETRDSRNVIYCGYCSNHHKKMMRQKNRQLKQPAPATSTSAPMPTTPTSPSPGCTTPLSAIPPDMSLPEGGSSREAGHAMERTASGSPIKVTNKRERLSLSEVPNQKRPPLPSSSSSTASEVVLLSNSAPKGKQRKRKPSSSNDSSTSEAPSNASDVAVAPPTSSLSTGPGPIQNSSPTSLSNHLIPVSPAPLPPPSRPSHKARRRREEEDEGVVPGEDGAVVKMETSSAGDQDDMVQQMLEVSESRSVPGLPEPKVPAASASEQSSRAQAPPPRSLQELLERQWEQTAQFILDQAGKQNNAGSMLAHLHTLQTENRQMQSRIMELASQREFYLAINTKLRQTLSEHDLGRLPNGVQAVDTGAQRHAANSAQEPMEVSGLAHHSHQSHSHLPHGRHHWQPHPNTPPSPQLSNSLPREDQESLLHAHFSSSGSLTNPHLHLNRGDHAHNSTSSIASEMTRQQQQQQGSVGGAGSHPRASSFLSTFTQLPPQATSQGLPAIGPPPLEGVAILPATHGSVIPSGETPLHEVTQVTHSIQAPISSLTPLPNDGGCG